MRGGLHGRLNIRWTTDYFSPDALALFGGHKRTPRCPLLREKQTRAGRCSTSAHVKVFGCRPHEGGAAHTGAGVRKPPKEETAGRDTSDGAACAIEARES